MTRSGPVDWIASQFPTLSTADAAQAVQNILGAILCFSLLAGCGGTSDEAAKKAVLDALDKPGSVEFGQFTMAVSYTHLTLPTKA